MSSHVSEVAAEITNKVDAARDCKDIKQGILLVDDITDPKKKCDKAKTNSRTKFCHGLQDQDQAL